MSRFVAYRIVFLPAEKLSGYRFPCTFPHTCVHLANLRMPSAGGVSVRPGIRSGVWSLSCECMHSCIPALLDYRDRCGLLIVWLVVDD